MMIRFFSFLAAAFVAHVVLPPCTVAQYGVGEKVVLIMDSRLTVPDGDGASVYEGNIVDVQAAAGGQLHVKIGSVSGWLDSAHVVRLPEGIHYFTKLVEENDKNTKALSCRAQVWWEMGEHERAFADLDRAISLDPKNAHAHHDRGIFWAEKGEHDKAIADYDEAIGLDPEFADAYGSRGSAWHMKGNSERAVSDYSHLIRLEPTNPVGYWGRGAAWYDQREYDKAITDFDEVLALDPKEVLVYYNRGLAWAAKGEYDQAVADLEQAIGLDTDEKRENAHLPYLEQFRWLRGQVPEQARQQPPISNVDDSFVPARLLAAEAVQKDLELTADQVETIGEFVRFSREQLRELAAVWHEMAAPVSEARTRELGAWIMRAASRSKQLQAQMVGMLTPGQRERLKQIQVQYAISVALTQPELIKALKISQEQLAKIRQQATAAVLAQPDVIKALDMSEDHFAEIRPRPDLVAARGAAELRAFDGLTPEETFNKMVERTKERHQALAEANRLALEVLAPEQRAKLAHFVGKEIELTWDYDAWRWQD